MVEEPSRSSFWEPAAVEVGMGWRTLATGATRRYRLILLEGLAVFQRSQGPRQWLQEVWPRKELLGRKESQGLGGGYWPRVSILPETRILGVWEEGGFWEKALS